MMRRQIKKDQERQLLREPEKEVNRFIVDKKATPREEDPDGEGEKKLRAEPKPKGKAAPAKGPDKQEQRPQARGRNALPVYP